MNKRYSLVLTLFMGFVLSGYGSIKEDCFTYHVFHSYSSLSPQLTAIEVPSIYKSIALAISSANFTVPFNAFAPKIKVKGNLGSFPTIANGSLGTQGTNNTLFAAQYIGASQSKSYRILNEGSSTLEISNISILGANPNDFTISLIPESTVLPAEFTILEIKFSPLAAGIRTAIVSISSDDEVDNPYTFAIQGRGRCIATSTTITLASGPIGTLAVITGTNFDIATTSTINGLPMSKTILSPTLMEVTIPAGAYTGNITVENSIGCTSTIPFTVIDNLMGGCEGTYSLSDLLISEVTDATFGGLNYIEIFNGTGTTKFLGNYAIALYYNGESTARNTIPLNAVDLLNNSTYVLAIGAFGGSSTCPQYGGDGGLADQQSTVVGINKKDNEHDMIRLLKSDDTVIVDEFGTYLDTTWMDATIITGDRGFNFRRSNTASLLPNPNFNLADWNVIDWTGSGTSSCNTNNYSDIGKFDFSGGSPPTVTLQPLAPTSNCELMATLRVSGNEGMPQGESLVYQWFYNAPETSEWVEIAPIDPNYSEPQSPNLNILSTLNLNNYQYYAQIREANTTCFKASDAIRLSITKTSWNGTTWNPSPPDANTITVIDGNYTTNSLTGSFSACTLIVNSGHLLHITNAYYVEVINDVIIDGTSTTNYGEIVVETRGAFIQRGDGTDAGTFTLNNTAGARVKKLTALKQKWYDYTYWSSPVKNETIAYALGTAPPSRRFYFEASNYEDLNGDDIDDTGDDWQLASGRMVPGVGYASTSQRSLLFPRIDATDFNGEFNTGNISVPIYTNSNPNDKDWNFIGNPYPSAIDFKLVYSANSEVIAGAAYLWSHASPPLATNPGNQVLNFNADDYAIICAGSGNIAGGSQEIPDDYIASCQGFFVVGINNGGTVTFKNSMRMSDGTSNTEFFRDHKSETANKFWINLTSDNGVFNQILVAYVEGATNGFDGFAYDVERNLSSGLSAMLYTTIKEKSKKYAIQGKATNSLDLDEIVVLGFYTTMKQPTLFTLSVPQIQGAFFEENSIFIKDNVLNSYHNLSHSDYHFTSDSGEFIDRFEIVFKKETLSMDAIIFDTNDLKIIELSNGHVQFSIERECTINSIEIMDLLGRTLYHLNGGKTKEIYNLDTLKQSAFIARATLSNGQSITKRALKRF